MNFTKQQVADACRAHAGDLDESVLAGYDPAQLLWAICGNESSWGENCAPRHEPAYDLGGTYAKAAAQAALLREFGSLAACSYGPMQVMLVNAPAGYSPATFNDCDKAVAAGAYALNRLLQAWKPTTIAQIAACYNGGNPGALRFPEVVKYANDLTENYAGMMPEAVLQG